MTPEPAQLDEPLRRDRDVEEGPALDDLEVQLLGSDAGLVQGLPHRLVAAAGRAGRRWRGSPPRAAVPRLARPATIRRAPCRPCGPTTGRTRRPGRVPPPAPGRLPARACPGGGAPSAAAPRRRRAGARRRRQGRRSARMGWKNRASSPRARAPRSSDSRVAVSQASESESATEPSPPKPFSLPNAIWFRPRCLAAYIPASASRKQLIHPTAVADVHRDPDARRHPQVATLDPERFGEAGENPLGHSRRDVRLGHPGQQDRELVPAQPADHVTGSEHAGEPGGHLPQQLVARRVPPGVVGPA